MLKPGRLAFSESLPLHWTYVEMNNQLSGWRNMGKFLNLLTLAVLDHLNFTAISFIWAPSFDIQFILYPWQKSMRKTLLSHYFYCILRSHFVFSLSWSWFIWPLGQSLMFQSRARLIWIAIGAQAVPEMLAAML